MRQPATLCIHRTYKFALFAVVVVSAGLIANNDIVTHGMEQAAGISPSGAVDLLGSMPAAAADAAGSEPLAGEEASRGGLWSWITARVDSVRARIARLLSQNVLAYVFLAGFAGGLFSVVMRVRTSGLEPGEDVYKAYYILTKPLVGAFGALLLFILLGGGLVSSEIVEAVARPTVEIFGFGILAGFSERIVFPTLQ